MPSLSERDGNLAAEASRVPGGSEHLGGPTALNHRQDWARQGGLVWSRRTAVQCTRKKDENTVLL